MGSHRCAFMRPVALGALVWAALAPSALGAVPSDKLVKGPVLVGSDVMWLESLGTDGLRVRAASRAGAPAVSLGELSTSRGALTGSLAGSPAGYAVAYYATSGSNERDPGRVVLHEILNAPPRGSLTSAARCEVPDQQAPPTQAPSVDVSTEALAYSIRPCQGAARSVEVRPLSPGTGPGRSIPAREPTEVQTAGSFVAWTERPVGERSEVLVYDWRTMQLRTRVGGALPGGLRDMDLAEDGTVALVYGGSRWRVGVVALGATQPRSLPLVPRPTYRVRFVGHRLAFKRSLRRSAAEELGVYDLARHRTRMIDRDLVFRPGGGDFDYDGQRLAWEAPTCRRPVLRFSSRLPRRPRGTTRPRCRLELVRPPRLSGTTVRIRFACSGYAPEDCPSRIVLTQRQEGTETRRPKRVLGAARSHDLDDLGGLALIRLNRHGRAILQADRRLSVRITATTRDARGRLERRSVIRVIRK